MNRLKAKIVVLQTLIFCLLGFFPADGQEEIMIVTNNKGEAINIMKNQDKLILSLQGSSRDIKDWLEACSERDSLSALLARDYIVLTKRIRDLPLLYLSDADLAAIKVFSRGIDFVQLYERLIIISQHKQEVLDFMAIRDTLDSRPVEDYDLVRKYLAISMNILDQPDPGNVRKFMPIIPEGMHQDSLVSELIIYHVLDPRLLGNYFDLLQDHSISLAPGIKQKLTVKYWELIGNIYDDLYYSNYRNENEILEEIFTLMGKFTNSFGDPQQRKRYRYFEKLIQLADGWEEEDSVIFREYQLIVEKIILPQIESGDYFVPAEIVLSDLCQITHNLMDLDLTDEQLSRMVAWLRVTVLFENDFFLHKMYGELLDEIDEDKFADRQKDIADDLRDQIPDDIADNLEDFIESRIEKKVLLNSAIQTELNLMKPVEEQ